MTLTDPANCVTTIWTPIITNMWKSKDWKNNQVSSKKPYTCQETTEAICGFGMGASPIYSQRCQVMWQGSSAEFVKKFSFCYLRSGNGVYPNFKSPVKPYNTLGNVNYLYKLGLTKVRSSRKSRFHWEFKGIICIPDVPGYDGNMGFIRSFDFPVKSIYNGCHSDYNHFMDECVDAANQSIEWMCQSMIFEKQKD